MRPHVITIDGPAGCGKSTVARLIARGVDGIAFNSGLVYRTVTWFALEQGLLVSGDTPTSDFSTLLRQALSQAELELVLQAGHDSAGESAEAVSSDGSAPPVLRVAINGRDPGVELVSSRVTREIHWVADDALVRASLLPLQRALPAGRFLVAEGRDMGSVVYPDAAAKFFLTATPAERARRRTQEFCRELGEEADFERVLAEVERRDAFDRNRAVAPLIVPPGAVVVDSTGRTVPEVVEAIREDLPEEWSQRWTT